MSDDEEYVPEPHPWQIKAEFAKDSKGKKIEECGESVVELSWGYCGETPDIVRTTISDAKALRDKLDELIKLHQDSQLPYLLETHTTVEKVYNPLYGDDKVCVCGHTYYRHFDSYEDMRNVGCKYCSCHDFVGKVCTHER